MKKLLSIFFTMFKIGLFTFGGGYAMIAVIETELVEKKKWITHEEFLNVIGIAESSPGPIAVNTATYIGYKLGGVLGSFFCTLGVVLPSFICIFAISFFFEQFLALEYVTYAFRGIQVCVGFIILSAGIKMFKKVKGDVVGLIVSITVIALMLTLNLLAKNVSTIYYILVGGVIGLIIYGISTAKKKSIKNKNAENQSNEGGNK